MAKEGRVAPAPPLSTILSLSHTSLHAEACAASAVAAAPDEAAASELLEEASPLTQVQRNRLWVGGWWLAVCGWPVGKCIHKSTGQ